MSFESNREIRKGSFDEVFLQKYEEINRWAAIITRNNLDLSEDLVHDVYVRFVASSQGSEPVENFDRYIFISLRNSYVSSLRRRLRLDSPNVFVIDDQLANDTASLTYDPRSTNRVNDQLRAICHYVCVRRSTSIGASILILRFFYGYSAAEISMITKRSVNAVDCRLKMARREISTFLATPQKLASVTKSRGFLIKQANPGSHDHNILNELQRTVIANRTGTCTPIERMRRFYENEVTELPANDLAHLVSCVICLKNTNLVLSRIGSGGTAANIDGRDEDTGRNTASSDEPVSPKAAAAYG